MLRFLLLSFWGHHLFQTHILDQKIEKALRRNSAPAVAQLYTTIYVPCSLRVCVEWGLDKIWHGSAVPALPEKRFFLYNYGPYWLRTSFTAPLCCVWFCGCGKDGLWPFGHNEETSETKWNWWISLRRSWLFGTHLECSLQLLQGGGNSLYLPVFLHTSLSIRTAGQSAAVLLFPFYP